VLEHPGVIDDRTARTISGLRVDWGLVTDAVRYAVGACPAGPSALHMEELPVELYLRDALTAMNELASTFVEFTLPGAAAWWSTAPADLCDCTAQHGQMLAFPCMRRPRTLRWMCSSMTQ